MGRAILLPRSGRRRPRVEPDATCARACVPLAARRYARTLVRALQGEGDGVPYLKLSACCKHFAAYSLEVLIGLLNTFYSYEINCSSIPNQTA